MVNLKSALLIVIMLFHKGLTHIQSQIKPRLLFGECFTLSETCSSLKLFGLFPPKLYYTITAQFRLLCICVILKCLLLSHFLRRDSVWTLNMMLKYFHFLKWGWSCDQRAAQTLLSSDHQCGSAHVTNTKIIFWNILNIGSTETVWSVNKQTSGMSVWIQVTCWWCHRWTMIIKLSESKPDDCRWFLDYESIRSHRTPEEERLTFCLITATAQLVLANS